MNDRYLIENILKNHLSVEFEKPLILEKIDVNNVNLVINVFRLIYFGMNFNQCFQCVSNPPKTMIKSNFTIPKNCNVTIESLTSEKD